MLFVFLGCGSVVSDGFLAEGLVWFLYSNTQGNVEQPKVVAISLAHGFAIVVLVAATMKIRLNIFICSF
jgi:hypothetical protein